MQKERFKAIVAVYGIFRRGDQVFFMRRFQTGFMDGYYSLPAGHVEEGESIRQAFIREMTEETTVKIDWKACRLAHVRSRKADDGHRVDFFFTVDRWDGELVNAEPDKCDEVVWFSTAALPESTIPYIVDALQDIANGVLYDEDRWSESISSAERG